MKPAYIVAIIFVLLLSTFLYLIRDLYLPGEERPTVVPEPIACTMDAKLCPDGSAVGRGGPNCEFAPCPGFESCVAAGNPVMESYPRQCRWENGTTVTEVIVE